MFLTDLGEGHMETFEQVEGLDFESNIQSDFVQFDFPGMFGFHLSINPTVEYHFNANYKVNKPFLRRYPDEYIDFRGPPIQT